MENQIDIEVPKDITVKLQGLPIILKKGTKVFCRQSNFDFAMEQYEEWEKTSSPVEARVVLNFADIEKIYENNNIPMDADAIGLQPLYYSRDQLTKFIEELNFYLEKVER